MFHILAVHGINQNTKDLEVFYDKLHTKGISLQSQDAIGYTPFHYACENHFISLCEYMLKLIKAESILAVKSSEGFTPFICAIRGKNIGNCYEIINLLFKYNINNQVNDIYLEKKYGKNYKCTPLIHATRHFLEHVTSSHDILSTKEGNLIIKFLSNGSNINERDSSGLNCLMHCVKVNNSDLLELFLNNYRTEIKYNSVDNDGNSIIHHAVCPVKEGSFEIKKLLTLLINSGFPIDLKDNNGKTPVEYAVHQKTGVNLSILQKSKPEYSELSVVYIEEGTRIEKWVSLGIDYEKDAEEYFNSKSKELEKKIEIEIGPDPIANFPKDTHKLVKDSNNEPYDLTMTKVFIYLIFR